MINPKEYGYALFMLADEDGVIEDAYRDVVCLNEVLRGTPEYFKLLDTPAVNKDERDSLIDEALLQFNVNLINLVKMLADSHKAHLLPKALEGFFEAYDEKMGIIRADAISARPLDEGEKEHLRTSLERKTKKTVIIKNTVDPTLLGGMKIRYMGREIDGTLKTRLEKFENSLKNTVI